ncbi:MAG: FtsX-like permease family protein [Candidatus Cloacimonetes bacterium]|nr:FtsX-like permease family protein [Candidatus Cloacimonadota bacterium]
MLFRLAFKNIVGNGWRSLINMLILTIVLTGIVWMQSMYHSWLSLAERQIREWEVLQGHYQQNSYDQYDFFSWEKSLAPIPQELSKAISEDRAVPILLSPVTIYPQGRSIYALAKGIPPDQKISKLPSQYISHREDGILPAMIGKVMARNSRLGEGDTFTMRIRNIHGTFDAVDIRIAHIMDCPVPALDLGTIWLSLDELQMLKDADNYASLILIDDPDLGTKSYPEWKFRTPRDLLYDLEQVKKTESGQQVIMFIIFLFLAGIAIFDTQVLSVFKRRKEIGTLIALGMTKSQIIYMFTLEGVMYALFAVLLSGILGFPLFYYFATVGFKMPEGFEGYNFAGLSEPIKFVYPPLIVIYCVLIVLGFTALFSWIPVSRIARLKATDALRGKMK